MSKTIINTLISIHCYVLTINTYRKQQRESKLFSKSIFFFYTPLYLFQQNTRGSFDGKKNKDTATNMADVESRTQGLIQREIKECYHLRLKPVHREDQTNTHPLESSLNKTFHPPNPGISRKIHSKASTPNIIMTKISPNLQR